MSETGDDPLRALLERAPNPMIIVNRIGRITTANHLAAETFGYTMAELINQPVELLVPTASRATHVGLRNNYLTKPHSRPMKDEAPLECQRKDHSRFFAHISLTPVQIGGEPLVSVAVRPVVAAAEHS